MSKKLKLTVILILVITMLFGLAAMAYPIVAARYTESVRSEVHSEYQAVISEQNNDELNTVRQAAIEYNRKLYTKEIAVSTQEEVQSSGYWDQLRIDSNDVMCYIQIPAIDVDLPVYHGIGEDALGIGCGHMPQTSLPVGGENTHSVISAHSGMASSAMFSDLPLLKIGDLFFIDILGETLTYEVYDIPDPVLPHEIGRIQIQTGQDLCTLVTCVPFGVNSHRQLIHGRRIKTPAQEQSPTDPAPTLLVSDEPFSIYENEYRNSLTLGIGIITCAIILAIIFLLVILLKRRHSLNSSTDYHVSSQKEE